MKRTKLMWCAFCAIVFAAFCLVGCELNNYSIDAPADLQHRIDSIAAAKAAHSTGDTTYIDIATAIVGADDNSTGWNGAHSDYFTIPANKKLHLEFVNHSSGANNWNNWNLAVTNVEANSDDYDPNNGVVGYFTLRSDGYGWGNSDFDLKLISQDYPDTDGDGDIWNDFRKTMNGAYVSIDIDHSSTGTVFVTATAVGTNGTTLVETYQQSVSGTADIVAFLACDGSHFDMKKAYLLPSRVKDTNPISISITGAPASVELGDKNFWGKAKAIVTYDDGSSKQIDSLALSFNVIPDMTTMGTKTVIVSYNQTKQGVILAKAVSTFYTLGVTASVTSLTVTTLPNITTYAFFYNEPITLNTTGIVVKATYSDGSTAVMPNANLKFGKIPAAAGAQNALVSYEGVTKTITTNCPVTVIQGVGQVGANDFSSPWTTYSGEYTIASGSSKVLTMYCYSDNLANFHSPSLSMGKAGNLDTDVTKPNGATAVVRMDNWGWGPGYGTAVLTSDWNWPVFASNISGSKVVITVTNNGNNTADVLYNVTYATGETHYQKYTGLTVDSSDLSCALAIEEAYVVLN